MHDAVNPGFELCPHRDDHSFFTFGDVGVLQGLADTVRLEETLQTFFQFAFCGFCIAEGLAQFRCGVFPDVSLIIHATG